jgi:hypothetical protein
VVCVYLCACPAVPFLPVQLPVSHVRQTHLFVEWTGQWLVSVYAWVPPARLLSLVHKGAG